MRAPVSKAPRVQKDMAARRLSTALGGSVLRASRAANSSDCTVVEKAFSRSIPAKSNPKMVMVSTMTATYNA
jgi:hypothetical protein